MLISKCQTNTILVLTVLLLHLSLMYNDKIAKLISVRVTPYGLKWNKTPGSQIRPFLAARHA